MKAANDEQKSFAWMDDLIIDNFAGGGGASLGIEMALGRPVDIAINHDEKAILMHEHNHSQTDHYHASVWDVDPREAVQGKRVQLAWFSPDCKHFSKAKGGRPVAKEIRGLAWVAIRWAATVKPAIIMLENVEEFITWGPVVNGKPCPKRKGKTFKAFTRALERLGYNVEYKTLKACDYGAPTIRKRLFMVARRDGNPIIWPKPTHGPSLQPYRTAAEIIDWSIPCPSIFERKRPLAENTLRRIAKGLEKFVFKNPDPYIVRIGHTGFGGDGMQYAIDKPLTTITSKNEHCLIAPILDRQFGTGAGASVEQPTGTIMPEGCGKTALVSAFIAKHFGGQTGAAINTPFPTITQRGTQNQVVTATLGAQYSNHSQDVRAFLMKYYGEGGQWQSLKDPLHTVPTKSRFGLVSIAGEDCQIVDIGMRMLTPRELYRAQGFPDCYSWGNLTKTEAIAKCGNSVSPPVAKALVQANINSASIPQRKSA